MHAGCILAYLNLVKNMGWKVCMFVSKPKVLFSAENKMMRLILP